ncbi:MAG: hypothetical protein J6T30_00215 [Bacteroidales bacterium]|nr:hypothetical protein [Bacteroidales bacterium]
MRKGIILLLSLLVMTSCKVRHSEPLSENIHLNCVTQDVDGTLLLKLDDAECYSDMSNPIYNTAEWKTRIVKSGRYDIWLSSATHDTTSLHYVNTVRLNVKNTELNVKPKCDKISDNSAPLFTAESYLGTVYLPDTGIVDVQIICEQIVPAGFTDYIESKFVSLFFTPETK